MEEVPCSRPTPTDTPYRTPSSSRSRVSRVSRSHESMSPPSSPPPLPTHDRPKRRRSSESITPALDESISPLDPRRFTPTLHANLVAEILSLRRDLENKTKDIDRLESSLHAAQTDKDRLGDTVTARNREIRNLKHQLQLLEAGTLSALTEIAKERDNAQTDLVEVRRRLEQSQKRAKSQEENAERTQVEWDRAKDGWQQEKRGLEAKVAVVEGRLKLVLSEIAQAQMNGGPPALADPLRGSFGESPSKRSISALSQRRASETSNASEQVGGRVSALGHTNGIPFNLADELALNEEDEAYDDFPEDGRISPDALPEERDRPTSRLSTKAHKILGLSMTQEELDIIEESEKHRPASRFSVRGSTHTFSPPASPTKHQPALAISTILNTEIEPIDPVEAANPIAAQTNTRIMSAEPASPVSLADPADSPGAPWASPPARADTVMISAACQTVEMLPSPPLTPEMASADFGAVVTETRDPTERRSIATQTDLHDESSPSGTAGVVEDVRRLPIPIIAIIPPASRPTTPETAVVLPPQTKNAGCQVALERDVEYCSTSMQTDEIRLDPGFMDLPSLPASSLMSPYRLASYGKVNPPNSSRRRMQQFSAPATNDARRPMYDQPTYPPNNDQGPLSKDLPSNGNRPMRSSSLFAGFDNENDGDGRPVLDEPFGEDDDIFSRPTAKFTLRSGKMVALDAPLEDIGELAAADAGEAIALENLRQSEEGLPPQIRANLPGRVSPKKKSITSIKPVRRVASPRRTNIRRAALISSGTAAHSAQSSVRSSTDLASPTDGQPPPFPVPIRFSSARIGKSISEGGRSSPASSAASPTRRGSAAREKYKTRKPLLRKARSGPAISPGPDDRRARSRSPPLDLRVSIVPEMPCFNLPVDHAGLQNYAYYPSSEASAPRPSVATGPHRQPSHAKTNSDAVSMHQTSVVDAIAQAMVGEWMFKYVRRRKSFGIPDSRALDYDPTKNADEISAGVTSTGIRHKRWVWLAPYERSVMWSSKQPTSNSALLGKSGRKLTIQSVLDVKDDNPLPKGTPPGTHFNRSILILTPQRALKFTALTQERHFVWLTALSFLSHSPLGVGDLTARPPPASVDDFQGLPAATFAGSLRRRPIRDSIRIAKGSNHTGPRSFTTDGSLPVHMPEPSNGPRGGEYYDPVNEAALPPTIPRFSSDTRKRSNTAPRAPPSSFKGCPITDREQVPSVPVSGVGSTYSQSVGTTATGTGVGSERGLYTPSLGMRSFASKTSSRRGSEASAASNRPNLPPMHTLYRDQARDMDGGMDATGVSAANGSGPGGSGVAGTMRMDAFIESRGGGYNMPMPKMAGPSSYVIAGNGGSRGRMGAPGVRSARRDWASWEIEEEQYHQHPRQHPHQHQNQNQNPNPPPPPHQHDHQYLTGDMFGGSRGLGMGSEMEVGGGSVDPFRGF